MLCVYLSNLKEAAVPYFKTGSRRCVGRPHNSQSKYRAARSTTVNYQNKCFVTLECCGLLGQDTASLVKWFVTL